MIEKVERAIRDKFAEVYGTLPVNGGFELARAAVEAMMESDYNMQRAAEALADHREGWTDPPRHPETWIAMINAILNEGK